MNHARKPLRSRLFVLLIVVAVCAVAFAAPPQRAAGEICADAAIARYYSDATYTTQVGICTHGCCEPWTCSGTMTNFEKDKFFSCID